MDGNKLLSMMFAYFFLTFIITYVGNNITTMKMLYSDGHFSTIHIFGKEKNSGAFVSKLLYVLFNKDL